MSEIDKRKFNDRMMAKEIVKAQMKRRSINAGFSEAGYNFGLGKYIRDKEDYHRAVREEKAKDPNFHEAG